MAYIPSIKDYKPFYIQRESEASAVDTAEAFGMVARVNPYPLLPTPKEPYRNEWKDGDGDEEYLEKMYYEAFTFDVSFFVKAFATSSMSAEAVLRSQVLAFFEKVRSGELRTYDSYTGLGYRLARYAGYREDSFKRRDNYARAMFTVTFKVNDPVTRMRYDSTTKKIVEL